MLKTKISDLNRILQCIEWYKNYYYGSNNEIYIGLGGTTDWVDDANPDDVDSSITELTELIGISKADVDFIKETTASGADVIYADGSYWNKYEPNNPSTNDYDNIISEGINHLYIETTVAFNTFDSATFRKLSINHNPLEDGSGSFLCTDASYNYDEISSQGTLHMIGHSSKIILTSGQSLNTGLILQF